MFGIKTDFNEETYTTKLDRNAPDFKEKERKAAQIASEIMGVSDPALAEVFVQEFADCDLRYVLPSHRTLLARPRLPRTTLILRRSAS